MHRIAVAVVALVIATCGVLVPASAAPARAAAAGPKVAIIVGSTGSVTATYRAYADELYATAIQYTGNVVRVYSPDATWPRVKAAVNGASVIVYLGHGNGWPSPYGNDAASTTKDGFGLNDDANGDGVTTDSELKYYGEPYIRTLTPAPNAVVLLFHLCYASGNSEPGQPDPTLAIAQQRVDNYGAAFQAAGARAVIAIGHSHDPYYLSALLGQRESLGDYFANAPDAHHNLLQFPSVRTPGRTLLLDPDQPTPWGFWRSFAGDPTLSTDGLGGGSGTTTGGDPATMTVPGNASATMPAPLFGSVADASAGLNAIAVIDPSTPVRVDRQEPASAPDGSPIFAVHTAGGIAGWMAGSTLTPRDSQAPRVASLDAGSGAFSPDGNGVSDSWSISAQLTEAASWSLVVADSRGQQFTAASGGSDVAQLTWAPPPGSVPSGAYRWTLVAMDPMGNTLQTSGGLAVDLVPPTLTLSGASVPGAAGGATTTLLTPNGDRSADTVSFRVRSSEAGSVTGVVRDAAGNPVTTLSAPLTGALATLAWDGTATGGAPAPDGTYAIWVTASDQAGNASAAQVRQVTVDRTLGFVTSSTSVFYPQDGDGFASTATLGFRLAGPATVDWKIVDAAGRAVRTINAGAALGPGASTFVWDGRNDAGGFVAPGAYASQVVAADGTATVTQRAAVVADAFRIVASPARPVRGQRLTITVFSAEPLLAAPTLTVTQPGIGAWTAKTVLLSGSTYRAVVTLRASAAGTMRISVAGIDVAGGAQSSSASLQLR